MNGLEYSGTPLAGKLGLKENFKIILYRPPKYFWNLFDELPAGLVYAKVAAVDNNWSGQKFMYRRTDR